MKRILLIVAGLCAGLIVPLSGGRTGFVIIAMENLWNRAEMNNDAPAVRLLRADDFVMTVAEGTLYNKAQMIASVADKSYRRFAVYRHGGPLLRKHRGSDRRLL